MQLRDPWFVAVWPGMGSVSLNAGNYLCQHLGAEYLEEFPADRYFDIDKIEVNEGLAVAGALPSNSFYGWSNPHGGPDLLIFVGELQPPGRGLEFCRQLLDIAMKYGPERVMTFAAMGTQNRPSLESRVFAVANEPTLVQGLRDYPVELLAKGQITGLNGVLLAAALERSLPAACLLGEMPFFAGGVPNPHASVRVLEVFSQMSGIQLDLNPMQQQATTVQQGLLRLLEQMTQAAQTIQSSAEDSSDDEDVSEVTFTLPDIGSEEEPGGLPVADQRRIEELFRRVSQDRSEAIRLKNELDRLGVYRQYEDRFLDLFETGE